MKIVVIIALFSYIYVFSVFLNQQGINKPFEATSDSIPTGYSEKDKFNISLNYPDKIDRPIDGYAWEKIDFTDFFKTESYFRTVLEYLLKENYENDFRIPSFQKNKWYHAPAMNIDESSGRDFFRGLTRERNSEPFELHPKQNYEVQNWALALYNDMGSTELKRIWSDINPNSLKNIKANFPNGTVMAKLIFTEDRFQKIDYLDNNTLIWKANVSSAPNLYKRINRIPKQVKLIQVDLAIKDNRFPYSWVMGTFVYHKDFSPSSKKWAEKLVFVGGQWSEGISFQMIGDEFKKIKKSFNNTKTWKLKDDIFLKGPVDRNTETCFSCHKKTNLKSMSNDFSRQLDLGIDDFLQIPNPSRR